MIRAMLKALYEEAIKIAIAAEEKHTPEGDAEAVAAYKIAAELAEVVNS